MTTLTLSDGVAMPALGFGVFQTPPAETVVEKQLEDQADVIFDGVAGSRFLSWREADLGWPIASRAGGAVPRRASPDH